MGHSNGAFDTPTKIGDMLMNLFAIDENASCEILKKFELCKASYGISFTNNKKIHENDIKNFKNLVEERQQKGMDHLILIENSQILICYI